MYYLMIKTCNVTGLKYLCMKKTDNENMCFIYKGSGIYWRRHIKLHNSAITTKIIFKTNDVEEFKLYASKKSQELGVPGDGWANIIPETGPGVKLTPEQQLLLSLKTRKNQTGKTMIQRLGCDYIDKRKGKTLKEIIAHGKHSQQKPFKIKCGLNEWVFNNEKEFENTLNLYADPTLRLLKRNKKHIIKKVSIRAKHNFKKGDIIEYIPLGEDCIRYRGKYINIKVYINGVFENEYKNINALVKGVGISLYMFFKAVKDGNSLTLINDMGTKIKANDTVSFVY